MSSGSSEGNGLFRNKEEEGRKQKKPILKGHYKPLTPGKTPKKKDAPQKSYSKVEQLILENPKLIKTSENGFLFKQRKDIDEKKDGYALKMTRSNLSCNCKSHKFRTSLICKHIAVALIMLGVKENNMQTATKQELQMIEDHIENFNEDIGEQNLSSFQDRYMRGEEKKTSTKSRKRNKKPQILPPEKVCNYRGKSKEEAEEYLRKTANVWYVSKSINNARKCPSHEKLGNKHKPEATIHENQLSFAVDYQETIGKHYKVKNVRRLFHANENCLRKIEKPFTNLKSPDGNTIIQTVKLNQKDIETVKNQVKNLNLIFQELDPPEVSEIDVPEVAEIEEIEESSPIMKKETEKEEEAGEAGDGNSRQNEEIPKSQRSSPIMTRHRVSQKNLRVKDVKKNLFCDDEEESAEGKRIKQKELHALKDLNESQWDDSSGSDYKQPSELDSTESIKN